MKTYTIIKNHRGRTYETTGTVEELKKAFGYTIECGVSWMMQEPRYRFRDVPIPKSAKGLVNFLNKCVEYIQGGCFERDHYELAE